MTNPRIFSALVLTIGTRQVHLSQASLEDCREWINAAPTPAIRQARKSVCFVKMYSAGPQSLAAALKGTKP